jgi:hypothetical protein
MNALKLTAFAGAMALALGTSAMAQTGGAAGAGTGASAGTGAAAGTGASAGMGAGGTAAGTAGTGAAGTTGAGTAGTGATTGTTGAGAGTTAGTSPSGGAQGPGSNANIPEQCRNMVGRALGDCLKLHGGANERGAMGADHSTRSMSDERMKSRSDSGTARGNGGGNAPTGDVGGASPTK